MKNKMSNELQTTNNSLPVANSEFSMVNIQALKQRALSVTQIKKEIMQENVHYGIIPGCGEKPTLLKNGAELLCMAFKLAPSIDVKIAELGNGHREYTATTILSIIGTGEMVSSGIGCCSTMESKYRYRGFTGNDTGRAVPKEYWDYKNSKDFENAQKCLGGKEFMAKKTEDGKWRIFTKDAKQENPDIADLYNTVLKMAAKRSLIDAVLKATGGSCEFTQDIEDFANNEKKQNKNQYVEAEQVNQPQKSDLERFTEWSNYQRGRIGAQAFDACMAAYGGQENIINDENAKRDFVAEITQTSSAK